MPATAAPPPIVDARRTGVGIMLPSAQVTVTPGTRLGGYEVLSLLGSGGMGEVYRARDTKLNREVALKVLPEIFAADAERLARFRREAQLLASLNHPNIAAIYGLEDSDGASALVLELVEGSTLADRIARGPIPVDEALPLARQMAEALEAAHEKGVIHRDLKPANIKLTPDGQVKILDFGLAKLLDSEAAASGQSRGYSPALTNSPTITTPAMTQLGVMLGTAAYMSPEQAKARPADKRSDIWAFGCVLFEMLTGRRAFEGEDVSDTLAMVLRGDPDLTTLPADVPVPVRALIAGCLKKDARRRIGDISTILFLLDNQSTLSVAGVGFSHRVRAQFAIAFALASVLIGALGVVIGRYWRAPTLGPQIVTRFAITLPEGQQFTHNGNHIIAVSPDGTHVAYVADRRLYVRSISDFDARPVAGTEVSEGLISGPVFSPDGQSIAYWSGEPEGGTLKKVPLTGGAGMTLCRLTMPNGITWGPDGILAGQRNNTIVRVASNGGQPEVLFSVKDRRLWGPQMLPGGDLVLFSQATPSGLAGASSDDWDHGGIVVHSIASGKEKTVLPGGADARYLSTGHIIYLSGTTLFAVRFDLGRLETIGHPVPMIGDLMRQGLLRGTAGGAAYARVSETGTLVYVPGSASPASEVALIDRTGGVAPLKLRPGSYQFPRVSANGKRLAIERDDDSDASIWIQELTDASSIRQLTLGGRKNRFPVWSPDGQRIAFQSDREGDAAIFLQRTDGTGVVERLTKPEAGTADVPQSWSRDGDTLLFAVARPDATFTLNTVSLRDRTVTPFGDVHSSRYTPAATFSPDGRWVAYTSSEGDANLVSGAQVFVQPFPVTGARYPISHGLHPLWSPAGRELFYHRLPDTPDHMEVVAVNSQPGQANFTFTNPMSLPLRDMHDSAPGSERNWDMMPDGRFIGIVDAPSAPGSGRARINVVVNWFQELKQLVPME